MKLSKHIELCNLLLKTYGDHELTSGPSTSKQIYHPIKMCFDFQKDGLIKKKVINPEEEITTLKKQDSFVLIMCRDTDLW